MSSLSSFSSLPSEVDESSFVLSSDSSGAFSASFLALASSVAFASFLPFVSSAAFASFLVLASPAFFSSFLTGAFSSFPNYLSEAFSLTAFFSSFGLAASSFLAGGALESDYFLDLS